MNFGFWICFQGGCSEKCKNRVYFPLCLQLRNRPKPSVVQGSVSQPVTRFFFCLPLPLPFSSSPFSFFLNFVSLVANRSPIASGKKKNKNSLEARTRSRRTAALCRQWRGDEAEGKESRSAAVGMQAQEQSCPGNHAPACPTLLFCACKREAGSARTANTNLHAS